MHGQPKLVAESTPARVAGVRGPLHAAASLLPGRLEYRLHQQSPDAATAMALRDVKLLEVERPGRAHGRPQAGPGRDPRNHFLSAIHLWTTAPNLAAGKAAPLKPLPDASGCTALLGEISGNHLPDGLFTVVHGGPEAGEAVAGCAGVPWRTANRRAIMVGRRDDFLAGLVAAVSGLARMTGAAGHTGRTRVLRRYADDHRRGPVAVGDGRTGVLHPEDPRSPDTATPPRRRAGESLNLLSRDRTSDGHASIYCGNASCGRERAQIMVFL